MVQPWGLSSTMSDVHHWTMYSSFKERHEVFAICFCNQELYFASAAAAEGMFYGLLSSGKQQRSFSKDSKNWRGKPNVP